MDFDQLNTFIEVARLGSFSRAAEKVLRSQPAVSAQIRQLEQEYGNNSWIGPPGLSGHSAGENPF